jgi:hypothetical protein
LNRRRAHYKTCIADAAGSTGYTFDGIVRHLRRFLPFFVLLENVATLGRENIAAVLGSLASIGYAAVHVVMNATEYGFPMNRKRIYFVGFLLPDQAADTDLLGGLRARVVRVLDKVRVQPLPLRRFLLSRDHPSYLIWDAELRAGTRGAKVITSRMGKTVRWPEVSCSLGDCGVWWDLRLDGVGVERLPLQVGSVFFVWLGTVRC